MLCPQPNTARPNAPLGIADMVFTQWHADTGMDGEPALILFHTAGDISVWALHDGRCLDHKQLLMHPRDQPCCITSVPESAVILVSCRSLDLLVLAATDLSVLKIYPGMHMDWVQSMHVWTPVDVQGSTSPTTDGSLRSCLVSLTVDGVLHVWEWPRLGIHQDLPDHLNLLIQADVARIFDRSMDVNEGRPTSVAVNTFSNSLQVAVMGQQGAACLLMPSHLEQPSAVDDHGYPTLRISSKDVMSYHLGSMLQSDGYVVGGAFVQPRLLLMWSAYGQWSLWHLDASLVRQNQVQDASAQASTCFAPQLDKGTLVCLQLTPTKELLLKTWKPHVSLDMDRSKMVPCLKEDTWTAAAVIDDHRIVCGTNDGHLVIIPLVAFFFPEFERDAQRIPGHRGPITAILAPYVGIAEVCHL